MLEEDSISDLTSDDFPTYGNGREFVDAPPR
jgi:hypothetical protein